MIDLAAMTLVSESKISLYTTSSDDALVSEILDAQSLKRARKVNGVDQAVYFYTHISTQGTAFYYQN